MRTRDTVTMTADYQPTPRELYDLILSLKIAIEQGFARIDQRFGKLEQRHFETS